MSEKCINHLWAEDRLIHYKICTLCSVTKPISRKIRIGVLVRIKLWYNGVCAKHLAYKESGHTEGLHCPECQKEKYERHALKKQALDNLIVELRKGR